MEITYVIYMVVSLKSLKELTLGSERFLISRKYYWSHTKCMRINPLYYTEYSLYIYVYVVPNNYVYIYILCIICIYIIWFKSILITWNVIELFTNASECFTYVLKRCFRYVCWLTLILNLENILFHVTSGRNCVEHTSVGTKYSKGTMLVGVPSSTVFRLHFSPVCAACR